MSDDRSGSEQDSGLGEAYRRLGLKEGATIREVMEAHRDLVTIWDPRRFPDNPRLQQRASDELGRVNAAFEVIRSHLLGGGSEARPGGIQGPLHPSPRSLYSDTLAPRKKGQRGKPPAWIAVAVALAAVVAGWLILGPGQDSGKEADEVPSQEAADSVNFGDVDERLAEQSAVTVPPEESKAVGGRDAGPQDSQSMGPDTPVRQAFELLAEKSTVVKALLERGRYQDLEYRRWEPLRTQMPEIVLAVVALRRGNQQEVQLHWSVNLSTATVRAVNAEALAAERPEPADKPSLVREL